MADEVKKVKVAEGYVPAVKPTKPEQTRGYVPAKPTAQPSKPKTDVKK